MAIVQAQGTINMETFIIIFTQGGNGDIALGNPVEVIGKDFVTGDLVSFEYDDSLSIAGRVALSVQKVSEEVVTAPTVSAQKINQLDDGCLFSAYVAKTGSIVRVKVDDESDDDGRRAFDETKFWKKVNRGVIVLSPSDRTMVEEMIASIKPGLAEGEEIRLWVSEEAYNMSDNVTLTTVYKEPASYDAQGNIIPANPVLVNA